MSEQATARATDRVLRRAEILKRTGVTFPTISRWEAAGEFPRRVKLGPGMSGVSGWLESEFVAWLEAKKLRRH
jgi:predicted DNA-binding transcriptional regulator AlpA